MRTRTPTTVNCSFCHRSYGIIDTISHIDPDGNTVHICTLCTATASKLFGHNNSESNRSTSDVKPAETLATNTAVETIKLLTPREIYTQLKRHVVAQDAYLQALATAGYKHIKRINSIRNGVSADALPKKENLFVIGGTGTGKTHAVMVMSKILSIPMYIADMTAVTMTGYIGEEPSDLLRHLVLSSNDPVVNNGIIVLDECDKLVSKQEYVRSKDINGTGLQECLLKIIEGMIVEVPVWDEGKANKRSVDVVKINTNDVTVIACGAFSGIDFNQKTKVVKRIGFRHQITEEISDRSEDDIRQKLIKAGMLSEFIGRFGRIEILNELKAPQLKQIMIAPENSVLRMEKERFMSEGLELNIEESAIELIAEKAYRQKLGARSLHSELAEVLDKVAFNYFGSGTSGTVRVFADQGKVRASVKENSRLMNNNREQSNDG